MAKHKQPDRAQSNEREKGKMMIAYVITERGEKKYWNRIGVAFENRDGSYNIRLDALPVSGQLHIREPSESEGE